MLRIGIVAGEASGDALAAGLIRSLREVSPEVQIEGVGGPKMQAAGCNILYSFEKLAVMGLVEVIGRYLELILFRRKLAKYFINNPPDVFIGVDSPDFNLGLEKILRDNGIKVVHYVSPSVWAWRKSRLRLIKKYINQVLVLFPFEEKLYRQNRIPVVYTGHPLADTISPGIDRVSNRDILGIPADVRLVAVMPGSRNSEIKRMLPVFLKTVGLCHQQDPSVYFVTSMVSAQSAGLVKHAVEELKRIHPALKYDVLVDKTRQVLSAADAGLLASGTVTLEAMLCGLPMAVAYRVNSLTAMILRRMVSITHVSLPNLLSGRDLVKEFLQEKCQPELMASEIMALLEGGRSEEQKLEFSRVHEQLRNDADNRAAFAITELVKI